MRNNNSSSGRRGRGESPSSRGKDDRASGNSSRKKYTSKSGTDKPKEFGEGKPYRRRASTDKDSSESRPSDNRPKRSYSTRPDPDKFAKKEFGEEKSYRRRPSTDKDSSDSKSSEDRPKRSYSTRPDPDKFAKKKFGEGKPYRRVASRDKPMGDESGSKDSFNKDKKRSEFTGSKLTKKKFTGDKFSKPSSVRQRTSDNIEGSSDKIRLNRHISNSGVCSRREADELIKMGLISVNGKVISELGYKVNPGDEVRYEEKVLRAEKPVYILLNKPKGFLTTTKDPQERKTVMHLLGDHVKERVYPVGRLDRNTTGLLLLTNDGELADKLMHPSYMAKKIYKVELDRALTKPDYQKIMEGVRLEEGKATVDDLAIVSTDGKTVGIEIHIGWNRVVRRIFESLEYQVIKLDRTVYAGLDKKDLPRGDWRALKKEEITKLKHFK